VEPVDNLPTVSGLRVHQGKHVLPQHPPKRWTRSWFHRHQVPHDSPPHHITAGELIVESVETTFRILLGTAVQHTPQSLKLGKSIGSSHDPSRNLRHLQPATRQSYLADLALLRALARLGAEKALSSSQDNRPTVPHPLHRRIPRYPLQAPRYRPWPSPINQRLGLPLVPALAELL